MLDISNTFLFNIIINLVDALQVDFSTIYTERIAYFVKNQYFAYYI